MLRTRMLQLLKGLPVSTHGNGRAALVFLTPRAQAFRPVAEATLRELARRSRRLLGSAAADSLGDALRQLAELE